MLRTDDGLRHWRFAATGSLLSTDADTTDAWTDLAARITAHADAARAQADARQRESDLRGPQAESQDALTTAQGDLGTATTEHTDARTALGLAETALTEARAGLTSGRAQRDHWEGEAKKLSTALLALPGRISELQQRESAASGEVRAAGALLDHIARQETGTVSEARAAEARERARKADERLALVQGELTGLRADQVRVQAELNAARAKAPDGRRPAAGPRTGTGGRDVGGGRGEVPPEHGRRDSHHGDRGPRCRAGPAALPEPGHRPRPQGPGRRGCRPDRRRATPPGPRRHSRRGTPGLRRGSGERPPVLPGLHPGPPTRPAADSPARRDGADAVRDDPRTDGPAREAARSPDGDPDASRTAGRSPAALARAGTRFVLVVADRSAAAPATSAALARAVPRFVLVLVGGRAPVEGAGRQTGRRKSTAGGTLLPPAGGRPIRTVANGECLLYAFLASDPRYVRATLPGLAGNHPDSFRWLADTGGVRRDLRRRAEAYSHNGTLRPHPQADPVIAAMQDFVLDYLVRATGSGQVPHEIIGQLRLSTTQEFSAGLRKMDTDRLAALARWHGISVPAGVDSLSDGELRRRLELAYATSPAPLTTEELAGLLNAVQNWAESWESAYGEVFPALTAHAFGVRMDVARTLTPGQRRVVSTLGPQGGAAAGSVEIYYNGVNHYDGSDATAGGTGTHGAPRAHGSADAACEIPGWAERGGIRRLVGSAEPRSGP